MDQSKGQRGQNNSPERSHAARQNWIHKSAEKKFLHQRAEGDGEGRGQIGIRGMLEELIERRGLRHGQKSPQHVETEHEDANA